MMVFLSENKIIGSLLVWHEKNRCNGIAPAGNKKTVRGNETAGVVRVISENNNDS
jgi:hypothetical protein